MDRTLSFFDPSPCVDSFYTIFDPLPPHLVHVVIECPLHYFVRNAENNAFKEGSDLDIFIAFLFVVKANLVNFLPVTLCILDAPTPLYVFATLLTLFAKVQLDSFSTTSILVC